MINAYNKKSLKNQPSKMTKRGKKNDALLDSYPGRLLCGHSNKCVHSWLGHLNIIVADKCPDQQLDKVNWNTGHAEISLH